MKKFIDISKYSPTSLLDELSEAVHEDKNKITCVDKEKRRMSFIHRMCFEDVVEAVFDENDRFEFYYEEEEKQEETEEEKQEEPGEMPE